MLTPEPTHFDAFAALCRLLCRRPGDCSVRWDAVLSLFIVTPHVEDGPLLLGAGCRTLDALRLVERAMARRGVERWAEPATRRNRVEVKTCRKSDHPVRRRERHADASWRPEPLGRTVLQVAAALYEPPFTLRVERRDSKTLVFELLCGGVGDWREDAGLTEALKHCWIAASAAQNGPYIWWELGVSEAK